MPITCEFRYLRPKTLNDVLNFLSHCGSEAKILAGGTDLIIKLKEDIEKPKCVIDIKDVKEFYGLKFSKGELKIGALATFSDIIDSPLVKNRFPLIWEMAHAVASSGIRNRATVVGNICSAVPSADSAPVLEVYEASVIAISLRGERKISINDWFTGPKKTVLREDEIVSRVEVPLPKTRHDGAYLKLSRYDGEDLAQAGIAVLAFSNGTFRIAHCALGPKPERAINAEKILKSKSPASLNIEKAKKEFLKQIKPISDIRSTKEYRIHMAGVMFKRAVEKAVLRLKGRGLKYGDGQVV